MQTTSKLYLFCIAFLTSLLCNIALCLTNAHAEAEAPTDFDGDHISDLTYITASSTLWSWYILQSSEALTASTLSEDFGSTGNLAAIGSWLTANTHAPLIVRNEQGNLIWSTPASGGNIEQVEFGSKEDLVIAGADFDGNGVTDLALAKWVDSKLNWQIKLNAFVKNSKAKKITFCSENGRAFFLNYKGDKDWLACTFKDSKGKAGIRMRSLTSSKTKIIKDLPAFMVTGTFLRPFPIKLANGRDAIGIVKEDSASTYFYFYYTNGKRIHKPINFTGKGSFVIGEFDSEYAGEEIIFQATGASQRYLFSPSARTTISHTDAIEGALVDEVSIGLVE